MTKIYDVFPFFNEVELLELRIRLLSPHVDGFVISEANQTHSGQPRELILPSLLNSLDIDRSKIRVLQVEYPSNLEPNSFDMHFSTACKRPQDALAWSRERLQRDAIREVIDDYSDDSVFIMSDCDEIVDPCAIDYLVQQAKQYQHTHTIRVPLVLLQGRADQRLFDPATNQNVPWVQGMFLATKQHIKDHSPSILKVNYGPLEAGYLLQDNKPVEDLGWHFTWMGDHDRQKQKSQAYIHFSNPAVINNISQNTAHSLDMQVDLDYITVPYPTDQLPSLVLSDPRFKQFFLPEPKLEPVWNSINTQARPMMWIVDNFYQDPYAVRKFALEQEYLEGGIGRGFIGRRTHQQFLWPHLKPAFERIMNRTITKWEEHGMNGRFQIAWAGEPLVYHCDAQQWAGMIYLTPNAPPQTGTTMWQHNSSGVRHHSDPLVDQAFATNTRLDRTPYQPVDVAGNVFNRLVIFNGGCIHSASEYFGDNNQNGRLWQMFFFD